MPQCFPRQARKRRTSVAELPSTRSGTSGEIIVAAALMRAGLRVLRPHWDDDEMDLIVLAEHPRRPIPLPVQIKAIQARASGEGVVRVDRVRRRYVDANPGICLAIYSHPNDKLWFITGASAI